MASRTWHPRTLLLEGMWPWHRSASFTDREGQRRVGLDDGEMGRRVFVLVTAVAVVVLGVVLVVLRWDDANKVAVVVSALAAVAAVGVGVWAAWPAGGGFSSSGWRVSRSGSAFAGPGGRAVSGAAGRRSSLPDDVRVDRSGDARAAEGGDAISGISGD
jgi:hypothetical protein